MFYLICVDLNLKNVAVITNIRLNSDFGQTRGVSSKSLNSSWNCVQLSPGSRWCQIWEGKTWLTAGPGFSVASSLTLVPPLRLGSEVSEITGQCSSSASLRTNLLWPNKIRYQRMTRNPSPQGALLLFFLLPPPLWRKRITEFHFGLFAAMLEARWQEQYQRNIPVISKKELKVELFSVGESCHLSFFFPSFPLSLPNSPTKNVGGGFTHTHIHTNTHTNNPPEEWLASSGEMRPDNLPFPPAAGCQKGALFLLRDLLPKMPGIKKEKTAGHCCVT